MVNKVKYQEITLGYNAESGKEPISIPLTDIYVNETITELMDATQDPVTAGTGITITDNVISAAAPPVNITGVDLVISTQNEFDAFVNECDAYKDSAVNAEKLYNRVFIAPGFYHAKKTVHIYFIGEISAYGVTVDAKGGNYTVFSGKSYTEHSQCKVEGITVTGGNANPGGAVYCDSWVNCNVTGNTGTGDGGGVSYSNNWINCTASDNVCRSGGGGAFYCDNWINCIVSNNEAGLGGGGAYGCDNWVNCVSTLNTSRSIASHAGGAGAYNCANWVNCTVVDNTAELGSSAGAKSCANWTGCVLFGNLVVEGRLDIDSYCTNFIYCCYYEAPTSISTSNYNIKSPT